LSPWASTLDHYEVLALRNDSWLSFGFTFIRYFDILTGFKEFLHELNICTQYNELHYVALCAFALEDLNSL